MVLVTWLENQAHCADERIESILNSIIIPQIPGVSMVTFRPFKGYLPNIDPTESICDRISPPYDVIDERLRIDLQKKPLNIARITLGNNNDNYAFARQELDRWLVDKKIIEDKLDSFYLYKQTFDYNGKKVCRKGIVGLLRLEDYATGNILPHEETALRVKEDRFALLKVTEAHLESILGVYGGDISLVNRAEAVAETIWKFNDSEGVEHTFMRISDCLAIKDIRQNFDGKKILIADGHHRYETALRYARECDSEESKYILATLVSSNDQGMVVFPTHRLIFGVGANTSELLASLKPKFEITLVDDASNLKKRVLRSEDRCIGLILRDGNLAVLKPKNLPTDSPLWDIDAYVFQEYVLKTFEKLSSSSGIKIEYEHDIEAIIRDAKEKGFDVAAILKPPTLQQIWKVAEKNCRMPKKTTYFWPKIWSGLVIYLMRNKS